MPLRPRSSASGASAPTPRSGGLRPRPTATTTAAEPESEFPLGAALAGGAVLGGAALLARNPKAPAAVRKGLEYANALRQQSFLSGLAPLKSILGNVGAAVAHSAETRSMAPIREVLSMRTLKDALPEGATVGEKLKNAFVTGKAASAADASKWGSPGGVNLPGVLGGPGRVMSALDDSTRAALVRAGMTPTEAAESVFQTPLGHNFGPFGKVFEDNPVADYLFPFRRTPLNQFAEGLKVMGTKRDPAVLGAYSAAGAAHGAATKDEKYPLTVPLAIAGAAKYGLPYGVAAIAGRLLAGGKGAGNTAGSVLPVSEYGLSQSLEDPLAPFTPSKIALIRALKRITE